MEWQPIETAPTDGTTVDIFSKRFGRCTDMILITLTQENKYYAPVFCGPSVVRDATHWMKLPDDPSQT